MSPQGQNLIPTKIQKHTQTHTHSTSNMYLPVLTFYSIMWRLEQHLGKTQQNIHE